jgi:type VI protein secretion system component Hcp
LVLPSLYFIHPTLKNGEAMARKNTKDSPHTAALEALSDEKLSAVSGAGASKARASGASSFPTETIGLSYTKIAWVYT